MKLYIYKSPRLSDCYLVSYSLPKAGAFRNIFFSYRKYKKIPPPKKAVWSQTIWIHDAFGLPYFLAKRFVVWKRGWIFRQADFVERRPPRRQCNCTGAEKILQTEVIEKFAKKFTLGKVFASSTEIENFIKVWGLKRPRAQALAAGTIFEIIVTDKFTAEDRKIFKIFFAGNMMLENFRLAQKFIRKFSRRQFFKTLGRKFRFRLRLCKVARQITQTLLGNSLRRK